MTESSIAMVEQGYALDLPQDVWLAEISGSLRGFHESSVSTFVFEWMRVDGRPTLGDHFAEDPRVPDQLARTFTDVPPEVLEMFFGVPLLAAPTSEVLAGQGIELRSTPLHGLFEECGFADVFAVSAHDPFFTGVSIGVGLDRQLVFSPAQHRAWSQVAAHIAAAYRLRRRVGRQSPGDAAELVLNPSGKVEHSGPGIDAELRTLLSEAVNRVERARSCNRQHEDALELWQSLIDGEWTLADHFESGSRRYYVAIRNPVDVAPNKALSRREAEVVTYVASGTSTQATAYALGLDEVTVRGYLHTALGKLGIRSRAELISVRAMLLDRVDEPASP